MAKSPPQNNSEIQRENEERFDMLQREMSSLKAMMEKLIEQNSEKVKQVDAAQQHPHLLCSRLKCTRKTIFWRQT